VNRRFLLKPRLSLDTIRKAITRENPELVDADELDLSSGESNGAAVGWRSAAWTKGRNAKMFIYSRDSRPLSTTGDSGRFEEFEPLGFKLAALRPLSQFPATLAAQPYRATERKTASFNSVLLLACTHPVEALKGPQDRGPALDVPLVQEKVNAPSQ
jgi:hypothetical protein